MKIRISQLTFLLLLISIGSFGQGKTNLAEKFIYFTNNYQTDSLQILISDNFQLRRTYTSLTHNKSSFLGTYIPFSRNLNGKYKILRVLSKQEPKQFLVEDRSDYFKYLDIDYPTWKISIITRRGKVEQVTIDTTESSQAYLSNINLKDQGFEMWLKKKYPDETREILYKTDGLLIKRLKEYSKQK